MFYVGSIEKLLRNSIALHWQPLCSLATHMEQTLLLTEKHLTFMLASKLRQFRTFNWIPTSPNANLEQGSCLLHWWQTAELIVHNFCNCLFNFRSQLLTDFSKLSVVKRNTRTLLAQPDEWALRKVSFLTPPFKHKFQQMRWTPHVHTITLNTNLQLISTRLHVHLAKENTENLKCL